MFWHGCQGPRNNLPISNPELGPVRPVGRADQNLTEAHVAQDSGTTGAGLYRERDGNPRQSSHPFGPFRCHAWPQDWMDMEVIQSELPHERPGSTHGPPGLRFVYECIRARRQPGRRTRRNLIPDVGRRLPVKRRTIGGSQLSSWFIGLYANARSKCRLTPWQALMADAGEVTQLHQRRQSPGPGP